MKIRQFLLFIAAFLLISGSVQAAQAPKLDTLLGEYKKARADVLGKLNESYAAQADALTQKYQAISNLDGADRSRTFAKRLRDPAEVNEIQVTGDNPNDPLAMLQARYASSRAENLNNVYGFYSSTAQNLRAELLKSNDQAGADVLTTFLEKIKPAKVTAAAPATPAKKRKVPAK
ncbi:MAG: hypothetical protein ABJF10_04015 [Chthoniobacter sp.]|uniref:hypothetical protein n=1 Tax=Chthoniobacter sp. TaxID=2510640 RepID=UPI0032A748EE